MNAPIPSHLVGWIMVGTMIAGAIPVLAWAWLCEHILPRKPYWYDLKPIMPRHHLESFSAWERRHVEAMSRYNDAERAMIESAGYRSTGGRTGVYSLPANHPLCVARLAALYPDGPPYEALAEIAGIKPQDRFN